MSKEEWDDVEMLLSYPYGGKAELLIDGYRITIIVAQEKPLKYVFVVYIDGKLNSEWILKDCEIRRKFFQKHTKSLLTAQDKKRLSKERKEVREAIIKKNTYYWYSPYWNSFRSLKSHFIKNNKNIVWLKEDKEEYT